jgi:hypothetical protein
VNDVAIQPTDTLHGQLQRGRGRGARAAAATPGAGDLVFDCVRHDPRWDRRIESRSLYYARLIVDLELPTGPIAAHLFGPADHADQTDPDEGRTALAIAVLADLVRLSRRDAAEPLRRYAWDGCNWYDALDALVALDDPDLLDGLDELAVARCADDDLFGLTVHDTAGIGRWAARQPRIAAALETRRAHRRPREHRRRSAVSPASSDADLLELARRLGRRPGVPPALQGAVLPSPGAGCPPSAAGCPPSGAARTPPGTSQPSASGTPTPPGDPSMPVGRLFTFPGRRAPLPGRRSPGTATDQGLAAILELGRRRSPLVLDIAEQLLPLGPHRSGGAIFRALRDLGPAAVPRARTWAADERPYADVAIRILARHGSARDIPVLLGRLDRALNEREWACAAGPVEGLGRLRAAAAVPALRAAWQPTNYSYLRPRLLAALQAIDPQVAEPYAVEALWDCEDHARARAARAVPLAGETGLRLRRLRDEAAEDPEVRAAAARRLHGRRTATGRRGSSR